MPERSSPDEPGDSGDSTAAPVPSGVAERAARVLVVDDSSLVRRTVERWLAERGYQVETASSGEEAFDRCLRQQFDVVVSDVTMGALSGFQLCRLLRSDSATAQTPVVLLTAAGDPKSRFWGRNAGADDYVAKEAMQQDLLPAIERLLEARPAAASPNPEAAAPSTRDPMQRLAQVLDRLLFDAVVSADLRKLMAHLGDRRRFVRTVLELASEVVEYAYLVVRLEGPEGPSCGVHARGPWPELPTRGVLAGLGLRSDDALSLDVMSDGGKPLPEGKPLPSGEMSVFPIQVHDEQLGELVAFSGRRRLAPDDHATIELIARQLGVLTKSLFLMEQSRRLAQTDELTGLANRRTAAARVEHEAMRAERTRRPLTVALCDVDHFKSVNDTYGHNVGDEVLKAVSRTLEQSVRRVDLASRWGGEEFLIVLTDASEAGGRVVGERLRAAIAAMAPVECGPDQVTISIGIASHRYGEGADALVNRADEALYRAKERGRNRVEVAYLKPAQATPQEPPAASGS